MENKISNKPYITPTKNSDINFVYKVTKIRNMSTSYWINNDEFAAKIRELKNQNITITDRMVYDIMRNIYLSKKEEKIRTGKKPEFDFQLARKCIKSLHYSLTGSKTGWETR